MENRWGNSGNTERLYFWGAPKSLQTLTAAIKLKEKLWPTSVQFSRSVVSDSWRPQKSQHARPPCPSPSPGVHSDSRPSSPWCHPAISSSVIPFSSCPQSLPASESFPMSQLFTWGGQSTGASALASFLPKKSQGWSPSEWTGWISLLQHHSSKASILRRSAFFIVQLSHPYMTTGKTIALTRSTFVGKVTSLLFNMLSVDQSFSSKEQMSFNFMAAVTICSDFGAQENKVCHCFHCFPIYLPWSDGTRLHDLRFFECWVLSQRFDSLLSLSPRGSSVSLLFLP